MPSLGVKHHAAKMTTAKVRQARKSFDAGKATISQLARKYDISPPSMSDIVYRRTWKHV